ncbi:DUF1648 domain-containing protein [Nocardioides sp. LHG3406-4]|uniref:DUF1648 domain-containing protein n=1 Tax=Nocardioides sp. LHG3406-4 TaxID=2804575 RepID=UPI003CF5C1A2
MTGRRFYWLAVTIWAACLVVEWFVLPDLVPLHFGADGTPDRWGTPTRAVLEMGAVGIGVGVLFFALAMSAWRLPFSMVTLPDQDFWERPENQRVARRRLQDDMYHLGALVMLLLAAVSVLTMVVAEDPTPSLWPWGLLLLALFVVGFVVATVLRMRFYKRLPGE